MQQLSLANYTHLHSRKNCIYAAKGNICVRIKLLSSRKKEFIMQSAPREE